MIRVSSTEFDKEVGRYQEAALAQPVVVTHNGRDRNVMISADEYRRLKSRDREVLGIEDFSDADIEAVRRAEPSNEAEAFNHEFTPESVPIPKPIPGMVIRYAYMSGYPMSKALPARSF